MVNRSTRDTPGYMCSYHVQEGLSFYNYDCIFKVYLCPPIKEKFMKFSDNEATTMKLVKFLSLKDYCIYAVYRMYMLEIVVP